MSDISVDRAGFHREIKNTLKYLERGWNLLQNCILSLSLAPVIAFLSWNLHWWKSNFLKRGLTFKWVKLFLSSKHYFLGRDMFFTTLLAVPVFIVIVLVATIYLEHVWNLHKYPKGPFPLPIIGNLMLLNKQPWFDFSNLAKTYGQVFSLSFGRFFLHLKYLRVESSNERHS